MRSKPEIRGFERFRCTRCGWCCQNQLISVSTVEIRAIIDFLNRRSREDFENHITACLAFEGSLNHYEFNFRKRVNTLLSFFEPCEVAVFDDEVALAKNHTISLLPETMRCVFYDPPSSSCFIYPARPLTCRMFPYEVKDSNLVMVDEADKCPGIGLGEVVDLRRHRRLSAMCQKLLREDDCEFWEFVRKEGLRRKKDAKAYSPSLRDVKLIDPFVKLGLIPPQHDQ